MEPLEKKLKSNNPLVEPAKNFTPLERPYEDRAAENPCCQPQPDEEYDAPYFGEADSGEALGME